MYSSSTLNVKYVYGVVPSRRLGKSLGVNVIPRKTCSYSCVYCQLGRTTNKTIERKSYFPKKDILEEIVKVVKETKKSGKSFDYITFVGEGEPTLCKDLGWLIEKSKEFGKVAVITNGSLLFDEDVRNELAECDVVIPSLDAADQKTFLRINRPVRLSIDKIIEGMIEFRKIFRNELSIEVMLVKDYNDSNAVLSKIKNALERINPDKVYLMTFTRPPAEKVEPASNSRLLQAYSIIGEKLNVELIINPEQGEFWINSLDDLISILKRHPMRKDQIEGFLKKLNLDIKTIKNLGVKEVKYKDNTFFFA
ncbi:MAG TPA: radical SAM protein [Archaeoglobus veneficus]|nr:radical SAM protein [Archaeoglobus veneficus]